MIPTTQSNESKWRYWKDVGFFAVWACMLCFIAHLGLGQNWPWLSHLGGEYLHISRSISNTGNFSDPFTGGTGPTAWMPPLLPYLMAPILHLFGEEALVLTVSLAQCVVVSMIFAWLVAFARRSGIPVAGRWIVIAFSIAEMHNLYGITHDSFLLLGLSTATVYRLGAWSNPTELRHSQAVLWGLWGGILALASPICSAAWMILTASAWRKRPSLVLICGLVAGACVAPWTVRNLWVFHALVPIKSNAGFDAWQANVFDNDGVLDSDTFGTHPCFHENEHRIEIRNRGEVVYCQEKGRLFWDWIKVHPTEYLRKVGNRIKASTVFFWVDMKPVSYFWRAFPMLTLATPWIFIPVGVYYHKQLSRYYWIALAWMVLYLIPYWAITYYDRYGAPLIAIKAWLVIMVVAQWHKNFSDQNTVE